MIREGTLRNGLKILVLEDMNSPVVTVQLWYRTGSRNELEGKRGIAHLLEHMMFRGSEDVGPEDHSRIVNAVGGIENAATSDDATFYYETVPSDRLALIMELEAERMNRLKLDEKYFYKEREVVKEELRKRNQNNPTDALFERFRLLAYQKHPYRLGPIGTMEDLDAITIEDLETFYRQNYVPNNAVLIVVGGASFDSVMQSADDFFGSLPRGELVHMPILPEPEQMVFRREVLRFPTQLPVVIGGYKIPQADSPDSVALDIVQMIFGGGESCRLYKRLVRDTQLAVFAGAWNWKMRDPGVFIVFAGFLPSIPPEKVETTLLEEIEDLAAKGPTDEEIQKAKSQLSANYIFKLTAISKLGYAIGEAEVVEGDYHRFLDRVDAYQRVTKNQIKRCVETYLAHDRLTVASLLPSNETDELEKSTGVVHRQAEEKLEAWNTHQRFTRIEGASIDPIALPVIHRKVLSNGLKVMFVERHEQPVVYFDLIVPGGNLFDPVGMAGLTDMLARMLTGGTTKRNAEQIAHQTDSLGGILHASAAMEYFSVQGQFLKKDCATGLDLFADIILDSSFPEAELVNVKLEHEASVRMGRDQPTSLAFDTLNYLIYGYNHPRGRSASVDTVKAVEVSDLQSVYQKYFRPSSSILCITGDITPDEMDDLGLSAFESWTDPDLTAWKPPDNPVKRRGVTVRIVDKPDLTQSTIAIGHLGISRYDPDYFNLLLGNYILGSGGFSSRLVQAVRSRGGKTYSAGSWFSTGKGKGPFGAYTFTRNSETESTLAILLEEIRKIKTSGITAKELQAAKDHILGSYALKFETPHGVAEQLLSAEFFSFGQDYVRNYRSFVSAPTLDNVNHALQKHLDPENLVVVVVGNAKEITSQLSDLGSWTKVHFLDPIPDEERIQHG